jgi:hypothetical protein
MMSKNRTFYCFHTILQLYFCDVGEYWIKKQATLRSYSRFFKNVCGKIVPTCQYCTYQGVTKRCHLSWLTNSALVYDPEWEGGGSCGVSANEFSCTQEPN